MIDFLSLLPQKRFSAQKQAKNIAENIISLSNFFY